MRQNVAVARRMRSILPPEIWRHVQDTRDPRRITYTLGQLFQLVVFGMASGATTLRGIEWLGKRVKHRKALGLRGTPSDSRLYERIRDASPEGLALALDAMVARMHRAKQLETLPEIGLSLVAIDGKRVGNGRSSFHPDSWACGSDAGRYYQMPVLRAVHVGSAVKPILGQRVVKITEGEPGAFQPFLDALLERHGSLIECVSVDAGFTSMPAVMRMRQAGVDFIAALKGNQETLHRQAIALLGEGDTVPAEGWEDTWTESAGPRTSASVTRHLARTTAMNECHGWKSLYAQVWRVHQIVTAADGSSTSEDRYFLTSLAKDRLKPRQILHAVRAHWGIENDSNWTMDTQLREDERPWVRTERGAEILALLRCIACNLLRLLRCRALRAERNRRLPWQAVKELVREALVSLLTIDDPIWEPDGIG